ncbi:MAG: hypothetical protein ACFFDB_16225 [Promethearchaeota archaeon]
MFPKDLFETVRNEIITLLKSLDRKDFPAINSFLVKNSHDYTDYISEFIGESIRDEIQRSDENKISHKIK